MQNQKGYQTVLEGGQEFIIGLVSILSKYDLIKTSKADPVMLEPYALQQAINWCQKVNNGFSKADHGNSPNRAAALLRVRQRIDNIQYLLERHQSGLPLTARDDSTGNYITPGSEPGYNLTNCIYGVYWVMTHVSPNPDVDATEVLVNSMANDILNSSTTWVFLEAEINPF